MKKQGTLHDIFNDIQTNAKLLFQYQDKIGASDTTTYVSSIMRFDYPPQRVLSGPLVPLEYDPAVIEDHLSCIRTDNFSYFLSSSEPPKGIEFNECEHWFGAEYSVTDFDDSLIEVYN